MIETAVDPMNTATHEGGPVVVGVDGSAVSRAALRRAAMEAAAHGTRLDVVYAWNLLDQPTPRFDPHYGAEAARANVDRIVAETLRSEHRGETEVRVVNDHAGRALVDASAGAFLLVVGARGLGGLKRALLGSVSQHVVHRAACPVLVVR